MYIPLSLSHSLSLSSFLPPSLPPSLPQVNPPHYCPLVEIIPAPWTSESVVSRTQEIMRELGQSPVRAKKEINGFILNRLQYALIMEAWRLVEVCIYMYMYETYMYNIMYVHVHVCIQNCNIELNTVCVCVCVCVCVLITD